MSTAALRYSPDYRLAIGGRAIPPALRGSLTSVQLTSGLDGADRLELSISDPALRWQQDPLLALGNELVLAIGYAPDPPTQSFVGELVTIAPRFPSNGAVTLEVAAQDARHQLQQGTKTRWFAVPGGVGALPMPDMLVGSVVALENRLVPIFDPVAAGISALLGGISAVVAVASGGEVQGLIRHQRGESDLAFLDRIAKENGWDLLIEHDGALAGRRLRFLSPVSRLRPVATFEYGRSLISFSPRMTKVGQVAKVRARFWVPPLKTEVTATVGYEWDRNELVLELTPSLGRPSGDEEGAVLELSGQPVDQYNAPRLLMSELLGRLNRRLTASASVIGSPALRAGDVVEVLGVGAFCGRYRITEATHSIDTSGYLTSLSLRKEIWFEEPALAMPGVTVL